MTMTEEDFNGTAVDNKDQDHSSADNPCASWKGEPSCIHMRRARPGYWKQGDEEMIVAYRYMYARPNLEGNSKLWSGVACVCAGTGTLQ